LHKLLVLCSIIDFCSSLKAKKSQPKQRQTLQPNFNKVYFILEINEEGEKMHERVLSLSICLSRNLKLMTTSKCDADAGSFCHIHSQILTRQNSEFGAKTFINVVCSCKVEQRTV
jgi:hypothetical protein